MSAPQDITIGSATVHTMPESNPAGTSDTVALPMQGVTGGVPLPISASSLPLPSGAAQDGTDATGVTPPAGAFGIRGWLSSIYNKLNTSIGVTGTFWQATQPVSAASLPLPSGAAQDGTDANNILPPTGGAGIRGWLSGIYIKLNGTQAGTSATNGPSVQGMTGGVPMPVSGTFWQATQPISAASLPLPAGAATAANQLAPLPAGTNPIGSIIGRTTMVSATPAVTSNGAYAAGNEIGGLMTFPIGGAGSGTLMSMRVTSKSVLTAALKAYIFSVNPSNTTWADKTAPAINAADISSLLAVVTLSSPDSGLGTHTLWELSGIAAQFVAANLYVVLVTVSAATLTSGTASDITVQLGVSDD
jgi:hypothetical protein